MTCVDTEEDTEKDTARQGAVSDRVVRVLPDEPAINKTFDYLVPPSLHGVDLIRVGTMVRVPLHGRRVGGWVVAVDVEPETERSKLRALTKISGLGPPAELFDLAQWASLRWWGRPATFLNTASPAAMVRALPVERPIDAALIPAAAVVDDVVAMAVDALSSQATGGGVVSVRVPPTADVFSLLLEVARFAGPRGVLVVAPSVDIAVHHARRLRRAGVPVALLPHEWARAAAGGCVVVGARAAAWAPIVGPGAVVVLDEHDEVHQEERSPTWHARDVAIERARRAGVPCLLVSPVPSLEALTVSKRVLVPSRTYERDNWPRLFVVDRSDEEPGRQGLLAARLAPILRESRSVVCVLNRTGRARTLACASCGQLARCETCGGSMAQTDEQPVLNCRRCGEERPVLCLVCGSGRLKNVRMGVSRAREEIEALALRPVAAVTAATESIPDRVDVFVGTEAVLHRVGSADAVVFLEFDSELLAPRYRAADEALGLLVRAARLTGPLGQVVVQTRLPRHEVIQAALLADPDRLTVVERARREVLQFPPATALARVSGAGASEVAAALGAIGGVERLGPPEGPFLVRATGYHALCEALAKVARPDERVRIEVDPLRV